MPEQALVPKRKGGRRPIEIPLAKLEALCQVHATDEEIAAHFGCSTKTIERLKRRPGYAETFRRGKADGLISLRRAQYQFALKGSPSMLIWLGKQMLGQRERIEHQSAPIRIDQVREMLLSLSDEDFAKLAAEHGVKLAEPEDKIPAGAMTIDVGAPSSAALTFSARDAEEREAFPSGSAIDVQTESP